MIYLLGQFETIRRKIHNIKKLLRQDLHKQVVLLINILAALKHFVHHDFVHLVLLTNETFALRSLLIVQFLEGAHALDAARVDLAELVVEFVINLGESLNHLNIFIARIFVTINKVKLGMLHDFGFVLDIFAYRMHLNVLVWFGRSLLLDLHWLVAFLIS